MKKLMNKCLLLLMLTFALAPLNFAIAQNACGCTPITTDEYYIHGVSTTPNAYVIIHYKRITCGSTTGIMFSSATFVSDPSGYFNSGNWNTHYKAAQQAVLISIGAGTGNMSFVYPASCMAMAEIKYPADAICYWFAPEGPNAGQIVASGPLGTTIEFLDCGTTNCCKIDYKYDLSTGKYKMTSMSDDKPCPNTPPRITSKTFTCQDKYNRPVTYKGTVRITEPCKSFCVMALNTFKTTNVSDYQPFPDPMDFNVSPTPARDFIEFSHTTDFERVEVYDINGKKLLQQNNFDNKRIDISTLPPGLHFVRVYFTNTAIRTIKILKY